MFGWKDQRIKVHCVLSCMCEVVKRHSNVDYRPFYFNVWEEQFGWHASGLSYYSDSFQPTRLMEWNERLFGIRSVQWHDPHQDPATNAAKLVELVEQAPRHRHVVVQIDMSLMPERENKFNLNPFPHYVIVSATDREDEWFMLDADMKWEGTVSREQLLLAFVHNAYPDGFYMDATTIQAPTPENIIAYFYDAFHLDKNELVTGLRTLVARLTEDPAKIASLGDALKHLYVIVIRKYGYDYALMFFHDELQLPRDNYEYWAQQIRDLVQAFNTLQFQAVKMSLTGSTGQLTSILETLDKAEAIERGIKSELKRELTLWSAAQYANVKGGTF
ncbi:hypothetical protein ASG89_17400 [Paenibacillus sp. Soil766]|uniref:DUF6005 family protein n=1 Tax=Paenibacillus sp. Soil766 TaxID=1736404 RepID=UPI00070E9F0E|nr:DUF6005 family protein [Paenibacillus sp. Soil766]KRF07125.1 hypothetical protein ASG89_17400 [Paenibacillus sp. Soil766]